MKTCLVAAVVVAAASTAASAQVIEVGNHGRTYTGYSRGFSYIAPVDHTIIRLELPAETFTPGALASYLVGVNGVTAPGSYQMGVAGAISVSINVLAGDEVLILGNWTAGAPGSFTAVNSYSDGTAPYASSVIGFAGFSMDLFRAGFQSDIALGTASAGSSFTGLTGSFARIYVTVIPAPASLALLSLGGLVAVRRRR